MVATIVLHAATFNPGFETRDTTRFFEQARGIVEGRGPVSDGDINLSLPVGYPLFLSLFLAIDAPELVIRVVQVFLSIAGCYLIYAAVRPYSQIWALRALWIVGTCPWLLQRAGVLLSESLGFFVCACLMACFSCAERRRAGGAFSLGLMATVLSLISPYAVFLAATLLGYFALANLRRPRLVTSAIVGALCVAIPWCACAAYLVKYRGAGFGTVQGMAASSFSGTYETVRERLHGRREPDSAITQGWEFQKFMQESVIQESDLAMFFERNDKYQVECLPKRAFSSEAQRHDAISRGQEYAAGRLSRADMDRYYTELRAERLRQRGWQIRALYPVLRSLNLWVDMLWPIKRFDVHHAHLPWASLRGPRQEDETELPCDNRRDGVVKAIRATAFYVLYVSYPLLFLFAVARALARGHTAALAIFSGVFLYSAFSSLTSTPESRRNIVFFPAMAFTAAYLPERATKSRCAVSPPMRSTDFED
jgi:hypothetical protein